MIRFRQAGDCSQFHDAAMIDDEYGATICKIIRKPVVEICQLICISCCRPASSNGFCILCLRLRPGYFEFHLIAVGTHELDLFIHGKAHRNRSLEGTWDCAGHHTIKRTDIISHPACQSHALL